MHIVTLDEAKPGDEAAEPVRNERGMVILPKGARLTVALIDRLRKMGVTEVALEGHDPNAPPPKSRDELLAELDERFEGLEDKPLMAEIKRIAREHLMDAEEA